MIAILIIAGLFYKQALNLELNKYLWPILAVAVYFVFQLIAGFVIGIFMPSLLEDNLTIMALGLVAGVIGVALLYFVMKKESAKLKAKKNETDLLDKF